MSVCILGTSSFKIMCLNFILKVSWRKRSDMYFWCTVEEKYKAAGNESTQVQVTQSCTQVQYGLNLLSYFSVPCEWLGMMWFVPSVINWMFHLLMFISIFKKCPVIIKFNRPTWCDYLSHNINQWLLQPDPLTGLSLLSQLSHFLSVKNWQHVLRVVPASRSSLPPVCLSLSGMYQTAPNGLSGCKSRSEELEGGQEQGRRISGCSQSDCSSPTGRVYAAVPNVLLPWHSVIVYMQRKGFGTQCESAEVGLSTHPNGFVVCQGVASCSQQLLRPRGREAIMNSRAHS